MRALSLSQPWAHVVVHGPKRIENRPTALHGPASRLVGARIAVHAAKSYDEGCLGFIADRGFDLANAVLVRGAVIGAATIEAVHVLPWSGMPAYQRPWAFGPLCILLRDVRAIATPIPCRGMLGFWSLPADVERDLGDQLGEVRR